MERFCQGDAQAFDALFQRYARPVQGYLARLTGSPATAEDLASQKLEWSPCPPPNTSQGGGESPSPLPGGVVWECSFMDVPLDYAKPDGRTIELALVRLYGSGRAFAWFNTVPLFAASPKDEALIAPAALLHGPLAWLLLALVAGHVGMVLLHRWLWRDGVAERMIGRVR